MTNNTSLTGLKGWKKYFLLYGVLLVLSHLVIWLTESPAEEDVKPNNEVVLQQVKDDHKLSEQGATIQFRDLYNGDRENPPVLLLLPGGPEGPDVFEEIIPHLSSRYRLIIPYLPGFGNPKNGFPNYSFKSLAIYTNQLLAKLRLADIHVLGYGLGGASAIYLAHDHPQRVKSLSLVSSIGVQELELLGSYRLNHVVQGAQLAGVWLLYNTVPHFGFLDLLDIDVSYAKSHFESDQRPLRSYLQQYQKPMLILHGNEDPLVPLAAAKEHHRIVPQSILKVYNADHDLIETHSDSVSQAISYFISDIESGLDLTASNAPQYRLEQARKPFSNVDFAKFKGGTLLLIMVIIMLATLISEDLTCIGAGLLAARGLIGFWPATLACLIGIFLGDIALYLAGRFLGRPAIRKAPFRWFLSEKDLKKSAHWFNAKGPMIIIASRFLPGSRLPTYFSAGIIRANFWMFVFYFLLAASVWTPLLVGISKLLGNKLLSYFSLYQDYAIWVFLGAIVLLIMVVKVIIPAFSYRGRRLLVSRYRRLTRWEYWSPFVLYVPVFFYTLYLGIKYRCLTLFTATNPAIPDSGFIGESKKEILDLFENGQYIAQYDRISSKMNPTCMADRARRFMRERALDFPVVLKPDVGQRGQGVEIIRDQQALEQYFLNSRHDVIIQEYVDGEEFGIFYYYKPGEPEGNIFSITTKKLIHVEGDGKKTIEELILEDDHAVNLAKYHFRQNEDQLYEVPGKGEKVPIVELGTHARGAVFGDGSKLITSALVSRMNEICQPVSGFYFGRFDIKAPSVAHLKKGRGLKMVEANGVTSESTNIYDSKYSFFDAERILFKQWRLAFEIGQRNKENGTRVAPTLPFIKRVFRTLSNQ